MEHATTSPRPHKSRRPGLKFGALLAASAIFFTACEEETQPQSPGDIRDNYLGVWQVSEEVGQNAPQFYQVEILATSNESEVQIEGLYNIGAVTVTARIDGTELSISQQESEGITFSGQGTAVNNYQRINLSYTANDGTGPDQVEAVLEP